jgi:ABC-type bacteriocin/lantibiotic exporter with double-glycine peptidase domain
MNKPNLRSFEYLKALILFAFRENPLLYFALLLSAISVFIEVAAMMSLLPLAKVASGEALESGILITKVLHSLGLLPDARALILLFICLFILRLLSQFLSQSLIMLLSRRLFRQLSTRAFHNLLVLIPIKNVEQSSIGSYISLAGDEAFRASDLIAQISQLIGNSLLASLYFLAILNFSGEVALSVVCFLLITLIIMLRSFRIVHRLGHLQVEQSRAASSIFLDGLNGLRTVRAFGAEKFIYKTYRNLLQGYIKTLVAIDVSNLLTRLTPAILLFAIAAIYFFQIDSNIEENANIPFLITIVLLLMRFFPVVGNVVSIVQRVISDAKTGKDVTELVSRKIITISPITPKVINQVKEISIQKISFSHRSNNLILQDVNIHLKSGMSYALIGPSGSGKSTIMDLLLRFYEPDVGSIFIDGYNINAIDEWHLRRHILLVSQETTIFNDTVANNIRFGIEASDAEVARACQIACIDDLVADLPQGLETILDYRGTNLSGGQRQRIGLARAFLRRAPVLLLDESTSALDSDTRSRVVANLKDAYQDRIIVFVTHDANIINSFDEVFYISKINQLKSSDRDESDAVV